MISRMISVATSHLDHESTDWLNEQCDHLHSHRDEGGEAHVARHFYGFFSCAHDDGMED